MNVSHRRLVVGSVVALAFIAIFITGVFTAFYDAINYGWGGYWLDRKYYRAQRLQEVGADERAIIDAIGMPCFETSIGDGAVVWECRGPEFHGSYPLRIRVFFFEEDGKRSIRVNRDTSPVPTCIDPQHIEISRYVYQSLVWILGDPTEELDRPCPVLSYSKTQSGLIEGENGVGN
jgi:hypothetical protein